MIIFFKLMVMYFPENDAEFHGLRNSSEFYVHFKGSLRFILRVLASVNYSEFINFKYNNVPKSPTQHDLN